MAVNFQLCIDCAEPDRLAHFWAAALGYVLEPPPAGFIEWDDYWRHVGVSEEELGRGADLIVDPDGQGPRIMFHVVPEPKSIKNRLHLDVRASGGQTALFAQRRQDVDAAVERLVGLGASVLRVLQTEGVDHYAVAMHDPEGNEFDVN